jgi:hypothetical protein
MTVANVQAGACGFCTKIIAEKKDRRTVDIKLVSECKAVEALAAKFPDLNPLTLVDIIGKGIQRNKIFEAGASTLSHSACPVLVGIIKAAEVELGLNIPSPVHIDFETEEK